MREDHNPNTYRSDKPDQREDNAVINAYPVKPDPKEDIYPDDGFVNPDKLPKSKPTQVINKYSKKNNNHITIAAVIIAVLIAVFAFIAGKVFTEIQTAKTLTEYFETVDETMSYDEAMKSAYEEYKSLKEKYAYLKFDAEQSGAANTNSETANIHDGSPKKMLTVAPSYNSGGNPYKEYSYSDSNETETFSMGGVKYTDGMTFNADINIFDDVSWAVYNLDSKYNTLEFTVGHVDGTFNGDKNTLQIFFDGELREEIPLSPDMLPESVTLDVSGVEQMKMQVLASGNDNPIYGVGNPIIK